MMELAKTTVEDLDTLFLFQAEKEGVRMAAFTAENPDDKEFYMAKWTKIVQNPDIRMRTVRIDGTIVGSVAHFEMFGETHVSYWIDRAHWGKGFATQALQAFIADSTTRPLCARVAFDNFGSQKVLEKCGFKRIGTDRGFANARKMEIEEIVYRFDG